MFVIEPSSYCKPRVFHLHDSVYHWSSFLICVMFLSFIVILHSYTCQLSPRRWLRFFFLYFVFVVYTVLNLLFSLFLHYTCSLTLVDGTKLDLLGTWNITPLFDTFRILLVIILVIFLVLLAEIEPTNLVERESLCWGDGLYPPLFICLTSKSVENLECFRHCIR